MWVIERQTGRLRPAYRRRTRHFKLRGFPYLVVYSPSQEDVFVLAVAHGKRKPAYWAKRLRDFR